MVNVGRQNVILSTLRRQNTLLNSIQFSYVFATLLSILVLVMAYGILTTLNARQRELALLMSQRGLQRSRTYLIAYYSGELINAENADRQSSAHERLRSIASEMETMYETFLDESLVNVSPQIQALYSPAFDQLLRAYIAAAFSLASAPEMTLSYSNPDYLFITSNADRIFGQFSRIAQQFEIEAEHFNNQARATITLGTALLVLLLLLEIPLIFRPMERRIGEHEQSLQEEIRKNKAVNALLIQTQADQNAMMDSAPRGMISIELDGTIRSLNPAAKRIIAQITGLEPSVNTPMRRYIAPEDLEDFEQNFKLVSAGEHITLTRNAYDEDGINRHYWLQYYPIKAPDNGQILGVGFSIEDLSELRRLQSAKRKIEERYHAAVDNSLDAFYLLEAVRDGDGQVVDFRITDVNKQSERELGMDRGQLIGALICELFPVNRERNFFAQYRDAFERQQPLEQEYHVPGDYHASGWYYHQVVPLSDGVAIINRDITKRKEADAQALEIALEAERRRILADFITSASHEFRTPLTIIDTTLYLLDRTLTEPIQHARVERIQQQSQLILQLVEGLVTMLSLDTTIVLEREITDITMLLTGLVESQRGAFNAAGLQLITDLSAGHPIQGNASRLYEAFAQLLNNALQYTPAGGTVSVYSIAHPQGTIIGVQDSGIGITEDALPRIFERFYRADSAHSTKGIGLGLSIAKRIFDLHGAVIRVESAVDAGTTFTVLFPHGS